jgi:hypothetical protein
MPPEVEGVFPSAHYGLLFTSYDRSRNKLTTYSVAFQPEDPFRLANKKSLVEMVALKSPYDHLQIDAKKSIREPDGTAHFTITMSLDEGWYVYADHPGLESLKPFRFQAAIEGNIASGRASIPLPLGIPVEDSQGRKWRKYDGKLVFGGCIRPDGANAATVEGIRLRVTYVLSNGQPRLPVHSKVVDVK